MKDELKELIRDLKILAGMMEEARKDGKTEAIRHYINAAGHTLNKITEEVMK